MMAQLPTLTPSQLTTVRRTSARDLTSQEFDEFCHMGQAMGLSILKRELIAIVFNKNKPEKRSVAFITTIGGYRGCAQRQGGYRPDDEEPVYTISETLVSDTNPIGIEKATVKVFKQDKHDLQWYPVIGVAYWNEFAPLEPIWGEKRGEIIGRKLADNWKRMPRLMIAKCAEAQALRKGWELSGLYTEEEMDRAKVIDGEFTQVADDEEKRQSQERLFGGSVIGVVWKYGAPIENIREGVFADTLLSWLEKNQDTPSEVDWFLTNNNAAFRQFFGFNKSDCLHVRELFEKAAKGGRVNGEAENEVDAGEGAERPAEGSPEGPDL
jgi:phage recombination protein Bet